MKRIFLFLACIVCLQTLAQEKMRITLNDGTYMDFDVRLVKTLNVHIPTPLSITGEWVTVSDDIMNAYSFNEDSTCCFNSFNMSTSYHFSLDYTYATKDRDIILYSNGEVSVRIPITNNKEMELVSSTGLTYYKVQATYDIVVGEEPITIGNDGDVIKYTDNYFITTEDNKIKALKEGSGFALVEEAKTGKTVAYRIDVATGTLPAVVDWTNYFGMSKAEVIAAFDYIYEGADKPTLTVNEYNAAISAVIFTFTNDWSSISKISVYFNDSKKMQNYCDYIEENYVLVNNGDSFRTYRDTADAKSASVSIMIMSDISTITYTNLK